MSSIPETTNILCLMCAEEMEYLFSEGEFPNTEHHYICPCGTTLIVSDDGLPNVWSID